MGFPDWTLLGMGLSLLGALAALFLALLGQSPGMLMRTGLTGAKLDQNVRAYTGYALALLLLSIGFFVAGVPLGSDENGASTVSETPPDQLQQDNPISTEIGNGSGSVGATPSLTATLATPITGSFIGPPSDGTALTIDEEDLAAVATNSETVVPADSSSTAAATPSESLQPSATPLPPTNTPTSTPIPTRTPSPTITPTPIMSQTAAINTSGSTIWLLRSPGGQNLITIADGEIVILLPRHANQGGSIWREISTGSGVIGWVLEEFLSYEQ